MTRLEALETLRVAVENQVIDEAELSRRMANIDQILETKSRYGCRIGRKRQMRLVAIWATV